MHIAGIGRVYVKATQFLQAQAVDVNPDGIRHDRAFALVEADGTFVNSDQHRLFMSLRFDYDSTAESLSLDRPDGQRIEGPAEATGRRFTIDHFGLRNIDVAELEGPWREALSTHAGRPISLVRCLSERRAIDVFPITFVTTGSLARLAREVGSTVDPARFRAGFVIDHAGEHDEDNWDGRTLKLGNAVLRVRTGVPRCAITGFNPRTGERDQEVMKGLIRYRDKVSLPDGMLPDYATPGFATYAEVITPGKVAIGDPVELLP